MKNARNFYYRLICACLVLAVIGSNTLVFASSPDDIHSQENNFCQELSGIPIFLILLHPLTQIQNNPRYPYRTQMKFIQILKQL